MNFELISGLIIIAAGAAWSIYILTIAFIESRERRRG